MAVESAPFVGIRSVEIHVAIDAQPGNTEWHVYRLASQMFEVDGQLVKRFMYEGTLPKDSDA